MSGTTNELVEVADYLYKKNTNSANEVINALEQKYMGHVNALFDTEEYRTRMRQFLCEEFAFLRTFTKDFLPVLRRSKSWHKARSSVRR